MKVITLTQLYNLMYDNLNPNGWWPGRSDWEVAWSTVLIQNTNWKNVERALGRLYKITNFSPQIILKISNEELKNAIKSAGFYERKSKTIKSLAQYFASYNFDLDSIRQLPATKLRAELLSIPGIGSETADVILLYVLYKKEFVVDKYARKLLTCLGYQNIPTYEKFKPIVERKLHLSTLREYQNFHALIDIFNQKYLLPRDFEKSFLAGYKLKV
ncbi:endonuclease-3 related protein [Lactobacillus colini]|uniref:Endonuclease-3 related protein n=1 Tax=Lactobacillus colini TaxID=1819254 RepID=A0ABS4MCG4_9LACO|nr:endonuclease III [Lactobacillus colini]MBP2057341.1 endonuclease-3 related protein [Lactobacillus colini]